MADLQITCITKPNPMSSHEHITSLGNAAGGWIWPREKVIESIVAKTNTFYVIDPSNGKRAYVGVVRETGKSPYVRSHADGYWDNNLLSLNQCPLR